MRDSDMVHVLLGVDLTHDPRNQGVVAVRAVMSGDHVDLQATFDSARRSQGAQEMFPASEFSHEALEARLL